MANDSIKPKEQASIVIIRLATLVDGRYRITRPAVLPKIPYDISLKYNPANKGIPAHSEASNGICQSLSVCFIANNECIRERVELYFSFKMMPSGFDYFVSQYAFSKINYFTFKVQMIKGRRYPAIFTALIINIVSHYRRHKLILLPA